jgi:hypothetical protein
MCVNPEKGVLDSGQRFCGRDHPDSKSLSTSTGWLIASFSPWLSKIVEKHAEVVESAGRASNAPLTSGKSERDLDLPEAAERRAEGRASGKSAAQRSEQRETSGGSGCGGVLGYP